MENVYLDNAATTQVRPEVMQKMLPYFTECFGNPSSIYDLGQQAFDAVAEARGIIASALGVDDTEIFFTSGGSESDNWAIKGVAYANAHKGRHIVTTSIEHHAVLHSCQALEREGFEVTYLPVDENGLVSPEEFESALRPDTVLATVMFANNEIGTIQPIAQLARIAHNHNVLFHTDAVQAFGHEALTIDDLGVDLLSASGHKFYGPKGVGFLYIRRGTKIANLIDGGQQERGRRASTENVSGIVGLGEACRLALSECAFEHERQRALRDHAIKRILDEIPFARLNGDAFHRLANNINVSFEFIEGEGIILQMAMRGVCVSSGSACTSGSLDPSHVLLAIGLPHEIAHGSVRMTLGRTTNAEQMDYAVDCLAETVANLRAMSPLYEDFEWGVTDSLVHPQDKPAA